MIGPDDWARLPAEDSAWLRAGRPDTSQHPDPVLSRLSSGDMFSPVQFSNQLGVVSHTRDEIPACHKNPLGWYGNQRDTRIGSEAQE